jgi:uncharacterized membrane protein YdjX (TVP38/TMEM64 family)
MQTGDAMDSVNAEAAEQRAGLPWTKLAIAVAALVGVIALGRVAGGQVQAFAQWVDGLGVWGPLVFSVGYAIAVVAFVPASLLTLAAGAVFGIGAGTVYVFFAAVLGSSLAFLVSRYLARGAVEQRLEGNQRFDAIDRAVGEQGRRIVFLLRLSPVFPFNLLNYALGLTSVRFADYFIASVGMLPGTLLYVYSGKAVGDVAALAGGAAPERGASEYALLGVGLLATAIVTILITRIAKRALDEATGESA